MRGRLLRIIIFTSTLMVIFSTVAIGADGISDYSSGSKAFALGRTATFSFSDVLGALYFPAGLRTSNTITSSFFYSEPFENTKSIRFGISIPINQFGTLGFSHFNSKLDDMDQTDINNEAIGNLSYTQEEYVISYGNNLLNNMIYGFNLKWLKEDLSSPSNSYLIQNNIGIDLSFGYNPKFTNLWVENIGLGITLGNLIQINDNSKGVPKHIRFIAENSFKIDNHSFLIAINQCWYENYSFEYKSRFHVGLEYGYKIAFLRLGYNNDFTSIGAGLEAYFIVLDYGYGSRIDSNSYANSIHNLTITAKF